MIFREVAKTHVFKQHWKKDDYESNKAIRQRDCLSQYWKIDLIHTYGFIKDYRLVRWLPEVEFKQTYINSDAVDDIVIISAEVSFTFREYTGPRQGEVLVHVRKLHQPLASNPYILHNEIETGTKFVRTFLPEVPELITSYQEENNRLIIRYFADFERVHPSSCCC